MVDINTVDSDNEELISDPATDKASEPYEGRWHNLISTTNWEKGKIISDWREALIDAGALSTEYSDEAWAQRVGGVTSPHVGRLRRVFKEFGEQYESFPSLYWSHFLAALDWDDAAMWLEGAVRSSWSVSEMRKERWEATGAAEAERPQESDIVASDTDEDAVLPAQGGGSSGMDDSPGNISTGPSAEGPDFGDEDQLSAAGGTPAVTEAAAINESDLAQPFAGLPELPSDMSDALEMFKLSILRHKAAHWGDVSQETVLKAIDGLRVMAISEM